MSTRPMSPRRALDVKMEQHGFTDEEIGQKFLEYQREMGPKLDASLRRLVQGVKLCPRCEDCDIPVTASICTGCEEEIAESAPPDGAWVNTPHGWVYE